MRTNPVLFLLLSLMLVGGVIAQDAERDAIKRTALNYAEGWY